MDSRTTSVDTSVPFNETTVSTELSICENYDLPSSAVFSICVVSAESVTSCVSSETDATSTTDVTEHCTFEEFDTSDDFSVSNDFDESDISAVYDLPESTESDTCDDFDNSSIDSVSTETVDSSTFDE
jgi:hypothetical protein